MLKNRADDFWFGSPEGVYNEGFDELFNVANDYQIPQAPVSEIKKEESPLKSNFMKIGEFVKSFSKEKKEDNMIQQPQAQYETQEKPALRVVEKPTYMPSNEVVVLEPRCFDDSLEIVTHLKERKSVILNLQHLDDATSQRVIDFVSGATFAFEGSQQRVGNGVFIFAHSNCKIETESASSIAYKDIFAKTFGI